MEGTTLAIAYAGAALGAGLAAIGAGLGIGRLAGGAAEAVGRQPSAASQITGAVMLPLLLLERRCHHRGSRCAARRVQDAVGTGTQEAEATMGNPLVQPDLGLYIWTIVTFLLLLWAFNKLAWTPLKGNTSGAGRHHTQVT
jgi:F-type H+-transporting ATPase subunit c